MLADELKVLLADTVTFYFQAQGCHWNVEGPDFSQYHGLFADIYGDVYGSSDPLAENLRKLGEYAQFNLSRFVELRSLTFTETTTDAREMAAYLAASNGAVIVSIGRAFDAAVAESEQGIANFLADRDDMHKKWRWQLTASLK